MTKSAQLGVTKGATSMFVEHPSDLVMRACMQRLGTTDHKLVGMVLFSSMMKMMLQQTGATKTDLLKALAEFKQTIPGPSNQLYSNIRLICGAWTHFTLKEHRNEIPYR